MICYNLIIIIIKKNNSYFSPCSIDSLNCSIGYIIYNHTGLFWIQKVGHWFHDIRAFHTKKNIKKIKELCRKNCKKEIIVRGWHFFLLLTALTKHFQCSELLLDPPASGLQRSLTNLSLWHKTPKYPLYPNLPSFHTLLGKLMEQVLRMKWNLKIKKIIKKQKKTKN